ncbi:Zinc finger MYND domain-containing protein 10 [Blattella germanica]|nr:Zinc finger MYND domain-containing protein 10 [Blattella germanica]
MPSWFEFHEHVQKLHQQALIETRELKEEIVKDMMVSHNKIPILVHEVICVSLWREKVLPRILKKEVEIHTNFVPYMVLIDYSASAIVQLLSNKCDDEKDPELTTKTDISESLEDKQKTLYFSIAIKCISIIGCIAQNLDSMPLSATSRMFSTHDIPILLTNIIERNPWIKRNSAGKTLKFEDFTWKETKGEENMKVTRAEAQTWLALRHLLLDPRCPAHYDINEYRKNQLMKLQCFLQETLMDQLSPLIDLKYWLAQLASSNPPPTPKRPLILEVIPQNSKRWSSIAKKHAEVMFSKDENQIKAITKSLSDAYNLDTMEALALGPKTCIACGEPAVRKCSRCKASYCGRECQVKNWPQHKSSCDFIASKTNTDV